MRKAALPREDALVSPYFHHEPRYGHQTHRFSPETPVFPAIQKIIT